MLRLDHVTVTVTDLDAAVDWYTTVLGLLPGAALAANADSRAFLELHQFVSPVGAAIRRGCDTGITHFAFHADDHPVQGLGVTFNSPLQYLAKRGLAGDWRACFSDPSVPYVMAAPEDLAMLK